MKTINKLYGVILILIAGLLFNFNNAYSQLSVSLSDSAFCVGSQNYVSYTFTGSYNLDNVFSVQLSDSTGSFDSPTVIGSVTTDTAGTILVTFPQNITGNTYKIRVVASDPVDSSADNGFNITFNQLPVVAISGLQGICANTSATYTATSLNNTTYNWSVTGGTIQGTPSGNTASIMWNNNSTGTINLTVTDNATTCTGTATYNVNIISSPDVQFAGPAEVCANNAQTYLYIVNHDDNMTNNWSVTGGLISGTNTGDSVYVYWANAGTGTITLARTNLTSGCTGSFSQNVTIDALATPLISGPENVCFNSLQTYATIALPNISYNWVVTGGTIIGDNNNNQIQVAWSNQSLGALMLQEINTVTGCTVSNFVSINATYPPTATIKGDILACASGISTFTSDLNNDYLYQWNVTGGTITNNADDNSINVQWNGPGTGIIYLTVTSNLTGCSSTDSVAVSLIDMAVPVVNIKAAVCENSTADYNISVLNGAIYSWQVSGGTLLTENTQPTITVRWGNAGIGTLTVTQALPGSNCSISVIDTVSILANPTPKISGSNSVCSGASENYTTSSAGESTYKWEVINGVIVGPDNGNTIQVNWGTNKQGSVLLTLTNTIGCSGMDSIPINISAVPDKPTLTQNSDTLVSSFSGTNKWYFNGKIIDAAQGSYYLPQETGYYSAAAIDSNGCSSAVSDSVYFSVTGITDMPDNQYDIYIYPNPAVNQATLYYNVTISAPVNISLINALGIEEELLVNNEQKDAGTYKLDFDISNLSSGLYFCRISAGGIVQTMKLIVMK